MKEHTFDRSVGDAISSAQPNFDDERTVQSARPVVPLEKIDAKLRHRKQWFLGGAFAIAMVLGAASALLASYLKLRSVPNSVDEISQADVAPAPVAVTEPLTSELPVVQNLEEPDAPVAPKKEPAVKRRTVARSNVQLTQPLSVGQSSEEDELQRIREAVLIDQWQERRQRRAARRERRARLDRYNHRDLSNLDEIFEGPRKP